MIGFVAAITLLAAAPVAGDGPANPRGGSRLPILFVMEKVVDSLAPRILARPAPEARRLSVRDGLLGIGGFEPSGGTGFDRDTPPRVLFPSAGAGNSLSRDPVTGRSYWTHLP